MSGYIGNIPTPQATQSRQSFTATAGQTTFATVGYTAGFIDVYLNGVHLLDGTDYTATNGSDIVLTTGAALNDVVEFVAYSTYEVNSQNYTGGLTVDNDGATVLTVDRATSDGTIIDLQKDGTTVGSIGTYVGFPTIGKTDTGLLFQDGANAVHPWNIGTNGASDGVVDLGTSNNRFKDLYLSGGVVFGTGGPAPITSNTLDDYEEGTFTPVFTPSSGAFGSITQTLASAKYTKVGRVVHFQIFMGANSVTTGTAAGNLQITGMPFTSTASGWSALSVSYATGWGSAPSAAYFESAQSYLVMRKTVATNSVPTDLGSSGNDTMISGSYITDL